MDRLHSAAAAHKKGQHLTIEERTIIQVRLKDGCTPSQIAEEIGCAPNTVRNEVRRGNVFLYHGRRTRYKAEAGQKAYEQHRKNSRRQYDFLKKERFIKFVDKNFHRQGWSLDACRGNAIKEGLFSKEETVCTKTLYNYADMGLLNIKNIGLPQKLSRRTHSLRNRINKRVLERSIKERPEEAKTREESGHWEMDLVIGSKMSTDKKVHPKRAQDKRVQPGTDKPWGAVMQWPAQKDPGLPDAG